MFTYDCEITRVVDGDTCDVTIDLEKNKLEVEKIGQRIKEFL